MCYSFNLFVGHELTFRRNPFATSAEVTRYIEKAEVDLPMHKDGLRRLQEEIDALVHEVRCAATQNERTKEFHASTVPGMFPFSPRSLIS